MSKSKAEASPNVRPGADVALSRHDREARLRQRARVVWFFGLSGAGKSTLAAALERRLQAEGLTTCRLDGDDIRAGLNRDLGFSEADRAENIRRVAEVSRLLVQTGIVVINAFITPTRALRELARGIVGADDFIGVYVEASWDTCRRRDPKGLYARAGRGEVRQFTGQDAPFEPPEHAELLVNTDRESVARSLEQVYAFVAPRLRPPAR